MTTEVHFDEYVVHEHYAESALGVRVVSALGHTVLLVSRLDCGNDATFSVNLRNVAEVELLERALAEAKKYL